MTRTLCALLLLLGQFSLEAAMRRRAVQSPPPYVVPPAIVTAAQQAGQAAVAAGVPAVQIAVSHHGRVLYSEAFGVVDKETATPATTRSVLRIASVTKPFTAAAILLLAERGALTLDDPIVKFVPEFDPRGTTITLRHLLTHTSGIPIDWYPLTPPFPPITAEVTREQAIKSINAQPLSFAPGSKFGYSNAGYLILGYVIESAAGRPYADFIHQEFALPLGLIDTGVCGTNNLPQPLGHAFLAAGVKAVPSNHTSGILSSGAMCSTASDLVRWPYLLATGSAVQPASYAAMSTPARLNNGAVVPDSYGLGLYTINVLGRPAVSHSGVMLGFVSYLVYFPEQEIAVAVIMNGAPPPAGVGSIPTAEKVAKAALESL